MTDEEKAAYKAKKKADREAKRKDMWEQKKANASPEQLKKMLAKKEAWEKMTDEEKKAHKEKR